MCNNFVDVINDLSMLHGGALEILPIMLNAFNAHYAQNYAGIIGASLFRNPHDTPTYKTKALHFVSNVQLVKRLLSCNGQQIQHYLALLWK